MLIARIQNGWKQPAGSAISRPVPQYYNLFHFTGSVQIREGDTLIQTQPNACIISRPKEPRWFYFAEDSVMNWMHNEVQLAPLLEKYQLPVGCVFYPNNPGFVNDMFRRIRQEFIGSDPYREELLDGYTQELLIKLSRSLHSGEPRPQISSDTYQKLCALRRQLQGHPAYDWTVEQMAVSVSLSPSRFHAVYKAAFGSSPTKELIVARMDAAKSVLLEKEGATLPEVAEMLGYKNQYHFIRQFKATTGLTPGEYRKQEKSP